MSEEIELNDELPESEELYERLSMVIDRGQEPLRIDKFLMQRIEGATRNKIQQAIENEMVLVNEKPIKNNYKVKSGDKVIVYETASPESSDIIPQDIPLNIVYEDDDLFVIDKPVGMVVHPGSGNPDGTLINAVAYYIKTNYPEIDESELPRYGLVHRIDKNTSGLLVMAKKQKVMSDLAKQFFNHTVHRRYVALVWGNFEEEQGTIEAHVGRHQRFRKLFTTYPDGDHGKDAITHYKVLENFNYVTLVECRLETGRTHQIRVHMQSIGHPLFNDDFYGGDRIVKGTIYTKYKQFVDNCFALCPRQALHAKELGFKHPVTGKDMFFESAIPEDMSSVIEKWRKYSQFKNAEE
ncbi:RluA family pseudouridine synthase [Ferruginibacter sp. HRS2-29]|uniref:RluA family pseudouridine synthase n=1 Tax=Ferruginibacter sp. HRS2-29 TaxID=2487334 RepID=UPI0020CD9C13|nr:RluA family pseudouridine synthase [Ferruginibacter sp. HRS2-29]MCP9751355.1 RluA family pseudouridine synthase [Ferruginibacter sp. HRS2-29]